jgi:hypothetical protein
VDIDNRRRLGQHFTDPRVADLIAAFCVRSGSDRVLDPACGDGAILLRARERRRFLGGDGSGLAGVEVDPLPATMARARLPGAAIVTADFLDMDPGRIAPEGGFDTVIGNPPYIRQEGLPAALKTPLILGGRRVSKRCDLHIRFWPVVMRLLRAGGRMGFLTSGTWLDASYGEPLRAWLARSFTVVAVIESEAESWFETARVRTVITIVEHSAPAGGRPVRFARLRERLDVIAPDHLDEAERLARFEGLARDLEEGRGTVATTRAVPSGRLESSRWGPLLRAPDLHFEILDHSGARLVPLDEVATVRWGIKTGDDQVFFAGREEAPVEGRFLRPVVFNLMELNRLVVAPDRLRRRIVMVDLREGAISGTRLEAYLRKAERERGTHLRPTCAAREREGRAPRRWFELRPGPPGEILWSIMHQYRHLAPLNQEGVLANDNLLLIRTRPGIDPRLLAALLNSHLQALLKGASGRWRNEGMLKMQAGDLRSMPVPDPGTIGQHAAARLIAVFDRMARRPVGKVIDECCLEDRRELDLAALSALGFEERKAAVMGDRIADELIRLHRRERSWELDAVGRRRARSRSARGEMRDQGP